MIHITLGSVADMQKNSLELFEEHYQELTLHKDMVKLEPNWEKYKRLEDLKMLLTIVAKDEDKIIGYSVFFVHADGHLHYKSLKIASNDILFVSKPYRTKSTAGLKLIRYAEKYFQETLEHNYKIFYHIKAANDFSLILKRMGYSHEETIMGKAIR
jgi:hypothetical protein